MQTTPKPAISLRDAVELIWFFNEGQACLEKSNFGSILERAELFAHRSIQCGACRGRGILSTKDLARLAEERPEITLRIETETENGSRAPHAGDWCPSCNGNGYAFERGHTGGGANVTAQPKGIPEPGGGYEAGHHDLERYATISRRVCRVEREDPRLLAVLAQLYGAAGERCVPQGHYGRQLAVMADTDPGKEVITNSNERRAPKAEADKRTVKSAKPGSGQIRREYPAPDVGWEPLHRPGDQVLLTEILDDTAQPRPDRTRLIREASEAADRLARSAQCLYTDSKGQTRRRAHPPPGPCGTVGCCGRTVPPAEAPTARPQCPLCGRYAPRGEAARQLQTGARHA